VQETGFIGRTWQITADDAGRFSVLAPQGPLGFTLTPPASRSDLAISRIDGDGSADDDVSLAFETGAAVHGVLRVPDDSDDLVPAALCTVEVLDADGQRWAVGLTDSEGRFTLQVAPQP
jgi:hypothetical protein